MRSVSNNCASVSEFVIEACLRTKGASNKARGPYGMVACLGVETNRRTLLSLSNLGRCLSPCRLFVVVCTNYYLRVLLGRVCGIRGT